MAIKYRSRRATRVKRRRSTMRRRNPFMGRRLAGARRGYGRGALVTANRQAAFLRIGGALGLESKVFDRYLPSTVVPAPVGLSGDTPPRYLLNSSHLLSSAKELSCPSQGVNSFNRDGMSISAHSIVVRGCVTSPHLADAADSKAQQCFGRISVYVALVLDTQTNNLAMNPADCFAVDGESSPDWLAGNLVVLNRHIIPPMLNVYHRKRFRILSSQVVTLGPADWEFTTNNTMFAVAPRVAHFELSAKLNGLKMNFNAATGAVAATTDNSIHLVAYTDLNKYTETGVANDSVLWPRLNYFSRFRFSG